MGDDSTFAVISAARRSRRCALALVLPVVLSLVACQRAGTIHRADGWERPEPFGAAGAAGDRHDAGAPDPLPLTGGGDTPLSSRGSGAEIPDVSFGDRTAGHSGGGVEPLGLSGPGAGITLGTIGPLDVSDARGGGHGEHEPATAPSLATASAGGRLTGHSRENATAADLLDHWGHRRVQGIVEALSLRSPAPEADAADLRALHATASATSDLPVGDEVRVLGTRRGVTWGRWTEGPADTLSITFDLSAAGPVMQRYPGFRAMVERAGKAWSHRIADTWAAWRRPGGVFKGWLIDGPDSHIPVQVGAGGDVSAGLEIDIRDDDIAGDFAGWAQPGHGPPGEAWEPRFAPLEMDRDFLREYPRAAGESSLFDTLAHEIGHALGAWHGGPESPRYAAFTDTETGTWTGPNVVAEHGGPAPFQDASDPQAWVAGERSPLATRFDFGHSGVCASLMAYCASNAPQPVFLPHDIDFAFLADLGMTVLAQTGRPETYGLAGWTGHAGFTLAVSRDLRIDVGDARSGSGRSYRNQRPLDVTDLFEVEADAFGRRSAGSLALSYPGKGLLGTVRYAGGLIGAAIDHAWLPPVTGDATLAVDLGTLGGTASFTSLAVHTGGVSESFAGGALHYPISLDGNAIVGTDTSSTLRADFYGTGHQDAAGTLHDPDAGLLASFGTTWDDRPGREDVVASAGHLSGLAWRSGAADPAANGWAEYRCLAGTGCEGRDEAPGGWGDWTSETRASVLAATAGWSWRGTARPHADHDFVRIARHSAAPANGGEEPGAADGYTGTLEHGAFGTGFETYPDSGRADPTDLTTDVLDVWSGVQGAASGGIPAGSARWSGLMLGYRHGEAADDDAFVEGLASVEYSLPASDVDVAFSRVATRDGRRRLADFGFEDTPLRADGTFAADGGSGSLRGALFGPAHEEAAGAFHHDAARVTGSFGAVRLPDPAPAQAGTSAAARALEVHLDGTRHVGAGVAPEAGALASAGGRNGVAVSSGEVQDGASAAKVIEYLREQTRGDGHRFGRNATGLPTFAVRPTLRLARGTSADLVAYVTRAVDIVNAALPPDRRIVIGAVPAPPGAAIGNVPDGQIFVDFTPPDDDGNPEDVDPGQRSFRLTTYVDPDAEHDSVAQRWEERRMRAARVWGDGRDFMALLRTVWVRNADTGDWETEVLDSPVVGTGAVRKYYSEEFGNAIMVRPLLQALGFMGYVAPDRFPDSFLSSSPEFDTLHLPVIDGDALLAAYGRLEPGTEPEELSPESLGPWSDTSFHLRGDMALAGGQVAAFGVALRNGLARPWAFGPEPLAGLADNTALSGTVTWNGALAGVTPEEETVAGDARLAVELVTLEGQLDFTGLERWGVRAVPGASGSGTTWGDGDLGYSVRVEGNALVQTGGDEGEVTGVLLGRAHEAMGGVLERDDLSAGFGGVR